MTQYLNILIALFLSGFVVANEPQLTSEINAAMEKFIADNQISGAVTMAIHQGHTIHHSAIGMANVENKIPMKEDTIFRIASMTKNLSAVLIKILEEKGKLNVNDKVSKYLPEFKNATLKEDDGLGEVDLRIWHLMSHTSGVKTPTNYHLLPNLEAAAKALAAEGLQFRPGKKWQYGKGMDVCGRIVEMVSGQKFDIFLKEQITDPLGLVDTAYFLPIEKLSRLALIYQPDPKSAGILAIDYSKSIKTSPEGLKPNPSSGLYSSTADMATFYTMVLNNGIHNGKQIISPDSVTDLVKNWSGEITTNNPIKGLAWGLGYGHILKPQGVTADLRAGSYGHGGAYGTQAWVDPNTKTIYLLMIQRKGFGNGDMSEIRKTFQALVTKHLPK